MFRDRTEAGLILAKLLLAAKMTDPVVYAIPRGGVVVAHEVAESLRAELAVIVVKKIGHPLEREYAVGAVAEGNPETVVTGREAPNLPDIGVMADRVITMVRDTVIRYRSGKELVSCSGRTAILVDDGVATGMTAKAALVALRKMAPDKLILATPVIDRSIEADLSSYADLIVAAERVRFLEAVGSYYNDFSQVSDQTVITLLTAGSGS